MKILFVNTYYYNRGGDTRNAFSLANILTKNSHEVKFFCMKHPKNYNTPDAKYFVDYIDYREMNSSKKITNLFKVFFRSIYYIKSKKKIGKLIDEYKPDIVHLHNIHAHITPSIIHEIKKRDIPICWTLNDFKMVCPNSHFIIDRNGQICEKCKNGKFYNALIMKCKKDSILASIMITIEAYFHKIIGTYKLVDKFICQSKFQYYKLIENGFSETQLEVVPLFVPFNYDKKIKKENFFLFFGRIEKFKGVLTLLKAIEILENFKFIIAGTLADELNDIFIKKLPKNVEYLGFVSDEKLKELIQKSKAVIVPSENYENQPYSILESFSYGIPVIATELGGMKELIENSNGGLLFPLADHKSLVKAIMNINRDEKLLKKLSHNAMEYCRREHDETNHYNKIINIYEEILKSKKG